MRKKAKKPEKKKKAVKKTPKKKTAKKPAAKKPVAKKPAVAPVAPRPYAPPMAKPPAIVAPIGGQPVGRVVHYYTHLSVAIVELTQGSLRVGDTIHIKGHTTDFRQTIDSMEIEHQKVTEATPGQSFGIKVREHAREHDIVYKVAG
jgi:hypothetical protein